MQDSEPHADVVVMGAARTGKTTLIHQIIKSFPPQGASKINTYQPTVEDSFIREFVVRDTVCRLRIIDTAGSYMFPAMHRLWLRKASAFILVCARDDSESLERIKSIVHQIGEERNNEFKHMISVLAVNKSDLDPEKWLLSDIQVELVADELGIPCNYIVSTSARTGIGILQLLKCMWEQNEETSDQAITFEPLNKIPPTDMSQRRASAFAVLFRNTAIGRTGNDSHLLVASAKDRKFSHTEVYTKFALSGKNVDSGTNQEQLNQSNHGSFLKKFGHLRIGGQVKDRTLEKRSKNSQNPTVINLDCCIS